MTLQVLVVDDEPLARSRLRTLLGDCTMPAAHVGGEAGNATQAMEILRRQPFDAVLLTSACPAPTAWRWRRRCGCWSSRRP
jgi:two-component system response regulator AlgR